MNTYACFTYILGKGNPGLFTTFQSNTCYRCLHKEQQSGFTWFRKTSTTYTTWSTSWV